MKMKRKREREVASMTEEKKGRESREDILEVSECEGFKVCVIALHRGLRYERV